MSEETTTKTTAEEPSTGPTAEKAKSEMSAILDELTKLSHKATEALQQAREREELKKVEEEIRKALRIAGERIDEVASDLRTSGLTEEIKGQTAKLLDAIERSKVTEDIRKGVLTGLRRLNAELTELLEREKSAPESAAEAVKEAAEVASGAAEEKQA